MRLVPAAPAILQRPLDRAADALLNGGPGPKVDFSQPAGEPALAPPDSVSWRVFKNPVALYIGGAAAVLLELAEPRVRTGVWEHTNFRTDALGRMRRTGMAAMVTVYGARSVAERMIAGVGRMHGRVSGVTPGGDPYRADDPELLTWVQATAALGFIEAYSTFVRPLERAEKDRFYAEGAPASALYGVVDAPRSVAEQEALFARMAPRLEPSPIISEFLDIMRRTDVVSPLLRPVRTRLLRAAVDILPPDVRRTLGLADRTLHAWERPLVRSAGVAADRVIVGPSPAVQACRRLGLPDDYLYRRA